MVLHPELEDMLFAIDHGDLSPPNIIVDFEYNVTSKVLVQIAGRFPQSAFEVDGRRLLQVLLRTRVARRK